MTEEFQATCEQVSGLDLSTFFTQWIYGEYYPQYRFGADWVASPGGGYDVNARIQQTQSWQIFNLPVDVRVTTGAGSFTFVARDSLPVQLFTFHVADAPTAVALDPDMWVLRSIVNVTGVEPQAIDAGLELAIPSPNPTSGETSLAFRTPREGEVHVDVIDATGRRAARLQRGVLPAGPHRLKWSGRGDGGRALQPGVYWVSLEFGGRRVTRRIALLN